MTKKDNNKVEDISPEDILDSLTDEELEALAADIEADADAELAEGEEVEGTGGTDEGNHKSNVMSIAMKKISAMTPDELSHFAQSLGQIGHEADGVPDVSAKNQASIAMKGKPDSITDIQALRESLKEDLGLIFGENKELSEDFKEKITTLFEASVSTRVSIIEQKLIEAYEESLEEELTKFTNSMVEEYNDYMTYVAQEWKKDNQVAIERSLKAEIAEEFMEGLKALFAEHYITVPEEKEDLTESLALKVEELEGAINEITNKHKETSAALTEAKKELLVRDFTRGMTVAQSENFKKLAEAVEFEGDDSKFNKKLEVIKESHFGKKKINSGILTEEVSHLPNESEVKDINNLDPVMKGYVSSLSRLAKAKNA